MVIPRAFVKQHGDCRAVRGAFKSERRQPHMPTDTAHSANHAAETRLSRRSFSQPSAFLPTRLRGSENSCPIGD